MNPEIEKLINMALNDGVLTDKEKEILLRKGQSLGIDIDELEMYLEGKQYDFQNKSTKYQAELDSKVTKEDIKKKELELKEQESEKRREIQGKILEIENSRKIRIKREQDQTSIENRELQKILEIKVPPEITLRKWWKDLKNDERNILRETIDGKKSFLGLGGFNPDEYQLAAMFKRYQNEINQ